MEQQQAKAPIIIDLDDPAPRGLLIILAIVLVLVVGLLAAPFVIADTSADKAPAGPQARLPAAQPRVCRPQVDVPDLLQPVAGFALPSWMRICDWFIAPAIDDSTSPQN